MDIRKVYMIALFAGFAWGNALARDLITAVSFLIVFGLYLIVYRKG